VGFFRREEPLHEKLAREGGLDFPRGVDEPAGPPTIDPEHPLWRIAGIHGIPRAREWDAVLTAAAPDLPGDETDFVALPDGTLYTDDDLPDGALAPLADGFDGLLDPPYHAFALRQEEDVWSAAALRVAVVEVPEAVDGDQVDLAVNDGERTVRVDGVESRAEIPSLEDFAGQQFGSFVLRASRLDETLWEVTVLPL
jgi:hypothetical protein